MTAAWVDRLGSTLLHFLWQGTAIAAIYAAARMSAARSAANFRYNIGCIALAAMFLAPLITLAVLTPATGSVPVAASTSHTPNAPDLTSAAPIPPSNRLETRRVLPWVVLVWLAGALILLSRLFGGWIVARRMRSTLVHPASNEWRQAFKQLAGQTGVTRPVQSADFRPRPGANRRGLGAPRSARTHRSPHRLALRTHCRITGSRTRAHPPQ